MYYETEISFSSSWYHKCYRPPSAQIAPVGRHLNRPEVDRLQSNFTIGWHLSFLVSVKSVGLPECCAGMSQAHGWKIQFSLSFFLFYCIFFLLSIHYNCIENGLLFSFVRWTALNWVHNRSHSSFPNRSFYHDSNLFLKTASFTI